MKPTVERLLQVLDIAASPVTLLTALWMKCIRRIGVQRMRASRKFFPHRCNACSGALL